MVTVETLDIILLMIFILLVLIPAMLLLAAYLTGHARRAYPVLAEDAIVQVGRESLTSAELAKRYIPIMKIRSANPTPDLLWIFYEIVENPNRQTYDIVYYDVWENEIHPNPTLHRFYSAFRAPYYGYPLYDIEYIQVSVDRQTGEIVGVMHEDSPGEDYFVMLSEHLVARYLLRPDGSFVKIISDREGHERYREQTWPVEFSGTHPVLAAATWNHLSRLILPDDTLYDRMFQPPLRYLTDQDYRRYKFVRKSQGDHRTREPALSAFLGGLAAAVLIGVPSWLISKLH